MLSFGKSNTTLLDQKTNEILELASQKKMLQIEMDTLKLEIQNKTLSEKMRLQEEAHKQKLSLQEEQAAFDRQKLVWKEEKEKLIAKHAEEMADFLKKTKSEYELSLNC
jgi:hypothetical protein